MGPLRRHVLALAALATGLLPGPPAPEPLAAVRVEALRSGAGPGEGTGTLARLVRLEHGDGAVLLHLELSLPGVASRVHLVEELGAGHGRLVYREVTGRRGRTLRVDRAADGGAELVTYGEGSTVRRQVAWPRGAVGPLERLEQERCGGARPGPFLVLDPLAGRVEELIGERTLLPTGPRLALVLWTHVDAAGALRQAALFGPDGLVALRPASGRRFAVAMDPARFDALRDRGEGLARDGGPSRSGSRP